MTEAPDSNVIFGIAKKWTAELEAMPLHTQGTIISMLNAAMMHRKLILEQQVHNAQMEAQERQLKYVEEQQRKQEERESLQRSGILLAK